MKKNKNDFLKKYKPDLIVRSNIFSNVDNGRDQSDNDERDQFDNNEQDQSDDDEQNQSDDERSDDDKELKRFDNNDKQGRSDNEDEQGQSDDDDDIDIQQKDRRIKFAEDDYESKILNLRSLITHLNQTTIHEIWSVKTIEQNKEHFVILYGSANHLYTCMWLVTRSNVDNGRDQSDNDERDQFDNNEQDQSDDDEQNQSDDERSDDDKELKRFDNNDKQGRSDNEDEQGQSDDDDDIDIQQKDRRIKFAEDDYESKILNLRSLITHLNQTTIHEIWSVKTIEQNKEHFVILYDKAMFHIGLIPSRWYNDITFNSQKELAITIHSKESETNDKSTYEHQIRTNFNILNEFRNTQLFSETVQANFSHKAKYNLGFGYAKQTIGLALEIGYEDELNTILRNWISEKKENTNQNVRLTKRICQALAILIKHVQKVLQRNV
ncbi:hypothetical protein Glove_119g45 [Diversispora epigaea]|uniref:Uncharacterized protein n=1 Tax=Diversispora epigaea TaxID=1348612 RepID=A0A397J8Q1_9GLOM|nr:hypothetical protein Glove_119g45 [Diversispora epigaea]